MDDNSNNTYRGAAPLSRPKTRRGKNVNRRHLMGREKNNILWHWNGGVTGTMPSAPLQGYDIFHITIKRPINKNNNDSWIICVAPFM